MDRIGATNKHVSTRLLATLTALLLALCVGLAVLVSRGPSAGAVARITVDGAPVRVIDLGAITAETTFEVTTPRGRNVIAVRPGAIRVVEADCPDQICVHRGWMSGGLTPIVCLPHGLVIELIAAEDDGAPDAVSG